MSHPPAAGERPWERFRGYLRVLAGLHDCDNVRASGLFLNVVPYTDSMVAPFREVLAGYDPRRIALNYSPSDPIADELTYGMWLKLNEMLSGTPYRSRFESAAVSLTRCRATTMRCT